MKYNKIISKNQIRKGSKKLQTYETEKIWGLFKKYTREKVTKRILDHIRTGDWQESKKKRLEGSMKILTNWLYPLRCPVCDGPVMSEEKCCRDCRTKLKFIENHCCCKCGKPLLREEEEYCDDCSGRAHYFQQGKAVFEYASVKASLYRFKYLGRQEYAEFYGRVMAMVMQEIIGQWAPDAIIPVPLSKEREKKRGYNQAALLARQLSSAVHIPCMEDLIERSKNTVPMKELGLWQRQINLKNAFIMHRYDVKLRRVIIIDDIYTTGSTVDAIASLLLQNGVQNIYFITLAIGTGI